MRETHRPRRGRGRHSCLPEIRSVARFRSQSCGGRDFPGHLYYPDSVAGTFSRTQLSRRPFRRDPTRLVRVGEGGYRATRVSALQPASPPRRAGRGRGT